MRQLDVSACFNCRYWGDLGGDNEAFAGCFRYAPRPQLIADENDYHVEWPLTSGQAWCGEWEAGA
jgi:hypothetical protein